MNIVIFGVTEDKNSSVWYAKVAAALEHIAGRPVDITDAFLEPTAASPYHCQASMCMDKRLLLSNTRKLAEVSEFRHMGVVSDEPLEVRRKNALKRMHDKAVRDGKSVSMATDKSALFIDLVFS